MKVKLIILVIFFIIFQVVAPSDSNSGDKFDYQNLIYEMSIEELLEEGIYAGVTKVCNPNDVPVPAFYQEMCVSYSGLIAIVPYDNFNLIHVYNRDGTYLLSFYVSGGAGGSFCIEWEGENLIIYWYRTMVVMRFDLDGVIDFTGKYEDGFHKYLDMLRVNNIRGTFIDCEGSQFLPDSENWLMDISTVRSKIVRIDADGSEYVVYRAASRYSFYEICLYIVIICIILVIYYKVLNKRRYNHKGVQNAASKPAPVYSGDEEETAEDTVEDDTPVMIADMTEDKSNSREWC